MAKNESRFTTLPDDTDKRVKQYTKLFELAFREARKHLNSAGDVVALYKQEIDPSTWQTHSDITLGEAKKLVDQMLPVVMQYLFGKEAPFRLIPYNADLMDFDTARKFRDWILYQINDIMKIPYRSITTLKDAIKLGTSYGIIEPRISTPPVMQNEAIYNDEGRSVVETQRMALGKQTKVLHYTPLSFGNVIPTPDGSNPEDVSCVFVLRFYNENTFRRLLDLEVYEGNADTIIKYARDKNFNGYIHGARKIIQGLTNDNETPIDLMNRPTEKDQPLLIPVIQCFAPDEHFYFACDKFPIYHIKNKYETLRNPVIKATFDPESEEWYSQGIIAPRKSMIMGVENFYNAIMDMITLWLHPHQVYDANRIDNPDTLSGLEPYGKTGVLGDPTGVLQWVQPPNLPAWVINIGNQLSEMKDSSAGQPRALQGQGSPGLVRGGSGAMESMLQNISGREKLTCKYFEGSWYERIVEQTMIITQILAKTKEQFPTLRLNEATGKEEYQMETITRKEICQVYGIKLSFSEKMRNALAEASIRQANYDRIAQNDYVNPEKALDYLIGEEEIVRELKEGADPEENFRKRMQIEQGSGGGSVMPQAEGAGTSTGGLQV